MPECSPMPVMLTLVLMVFRWANMLRGNRAREVPRIAGQAIERLSDWLVERYRCFMNPVVVLLLSPSKVTSVVPQPHKASPMAFFHRGGCFAVELAGALGVALVVLLLAAHDRDLGFHARTFEVEPERNDGQAFLGRLTIELIELALVKQQFAGPVRL